MTRTARRSRSCSTGLAVDLPHIDETGAVDRLFHAELQFMVAASFPRSASSSRSTAPCSTPPATNR
jgi:signal transduction protein with GAF and PtsI domain